MSKLPPQNQWSQPNNSDRTGSVYQSKNLTFDEQGYVTLSPRTVKVFDSSSGFGDTSFGQVVDIGKYAAESFFLPSDSNKQFDMVFDEDTFTVTENTGTNFPTIGGNSHATYFNDRYHVTTTDGKIKSRALTGGPTATWTDEVTSLSTTQRLYLEVFENKDAICVGDANTVKLYTGATTAFSLDVTLTIPDDFEVTGLVYNNNRMGVLTRPATSNVNQNAYFFEWDGAGTSANRGFDVGAEAILCAVPYKSTFVILTRKGELLQYNGGGFNRLATFPYFFTERNLFSTPDTNVFSGSCMAVEGERIYINTEWIFNENDRKTDRYISGHPSGIWCFDPRVGLYHRLSPSNSPAYLFAVTDANVNTSTEVMTVSAGTVPQTGSVVRYTAAGTEIGGLSLNSDYYVIKVSGTTFKLANSKEEALVGSAIDLTSAGSGGTNYFYMFDLIDYAQTFVDSAGAVARSGETNVLHDNVMFSNGIDNTDLTGLDVLNITIPFLENRGYLVLPKIFSSKREQQAQVLEIKHRPLDTDDKIIVKVKDKDVIGVPLSTTGNSSGATWTGGNELYTTTDFSEAKTHMDNGGSLEMEILSGSGAGVMTQVLSIAESSGTYSFVLEEEVLGVTAGDKCHFVVDNWEELATIDSTNQLDGVSSVPIGQGRKFTFLKVELRGWKTTIEEMDFKSIPQSKSG